MRYQPGERVVLEHTDDPHTAVRPAMSAPWCATKRPPTPSTDITWDSGSRLSMCLDAGDRVRRLSTPDSGDTGGTVRR